MNLFFTASKVRKARTVVAETSRGVCTGRVVNVTDGIVSFIRLDNGAIDFVPLSKIRKFS